MAEETEENQPSFGILAQGITDLSFERFVPFNYQPEDGVEPKMEVQVKVSSAKTEEENVYKVDLFLSVGANAGTKKIFLLELTYTGMFFIANLSNEMFAQVLNIECPRLLFPFARAIVGSTVAAGNMPMPLLPPIDFADLYLKNLQEQQQK